MDWITIISIVVGVILTFFGYKVQKAVISLAWFLIGFGISNYICPNFISNEYLLLGINIVVGLLLSSIGFKLEKLALVIAIAYFTYSCIDGMINIGEPTINFIIEITISMIVGGLSLLVFRPIIICVTAGYGTSLIKANVLPIINPVPNIAVLIASIIVFGLGILYQFNTTK